MNAVEIVLLVVGVAVAAFIVGMCCGAKVQARLATWSHSDRGRH